jgi:hypothetical protein
MPATADHGVLELALDAVAAVDRGRLDRQGDRLSRVHAESTELKHTTNGALARRQVLHKNLLRPNRCES